VIKKHIKEKRDELIWALSQQDYSRSEIGSIFGLNGSTVSRIIDEKPKDWETKWIKK